MDALKPAGPVHVYEVPPDPVAFRLSVAPAHTGPLFEAETLGFALTTTVVVAEEEQVVVVFVSITVYNPEWVVSAPVRVGSSMLLLNPAGPVHEYDVPPDPVAFRLIVLPTQ